jgi:hypothetical protein
MPSSFFGSSSTGLSPRWLHTACDLIGQREDGYLDERGPLGKNGADLFI